MSKKSGAKESRHAPPTPKAPEPRSHKPRASPSAAPEDKIVSAPSAPIEAKPVPLTTDVPETVDENIEAEPMDEAKPAPKPARAAKPGPKPNPLRLQLEALLFSSGKAMEEEQLASLTGAEKRAVKNALRALEQDYAARDTAIKVFNEGTTWKLLVHDEHIPLVRRIVADTELTRATMETLAVIAYHQPKVLQSKVVDLRGGNAYEHIAELERLGFIVKSKEGRSFSLRVTEKFFEYFDVEGEKGIKQVFKEIQLPVKEQQKRLGELDVVDLPKSAEKEAEEKKERLDGLEVVDEPEEASRPGRAAERFEPEAPPTAKLERDPAAENSFLAKLDAQIEALSRRNDELGQDPLFKVPEPAQPEGQPTGEPPTGPAEDAPVAEAAPAEEPPQPKRTRKKKEDA